jgi:hypothetical protein
MRLVVKLVRMIADLAGGELIAGNHLGEVIRWRLRGESKAMGTE